MNWIARSTVRRQQRRRPTRRFAVEYLESRKLLHGGDTISAGFAEIAEEAGASTGETVSLNGLPDSGAPISQITASTIPPSTSAVEVLPESADSEAQLAQAPSQSLIEFPATQLPGLSTDLGGESLDESEQVPTDTLTTLPSTQATSGGFEAVDNPAEFPARFHVSLSSFWDADSSHCSGTLIDSRHVITAAHCVYDEDVDDDGWTNQTEVISWFQSEDGPEWANSHAIHVDAFEGYTQHGWWDYDLAVVYLQRPLGVLTGGWFGYGAASCWNLTHDNFENYSYPSEGPYAGEFVRWEDEFDWCPTAHTVETSTQFFVGQSGSTGYEPGEYVVKAVASRPAAFDNTRFVRIWDGAFNALKGIIDGHRSDSPDLMPIGPSLKGIAFPQDIMPAAGETLDLEPFFVHNYSHQDFSGPVNVSLYLSDNHNITDNDTELWSYEGALDIDSMQSISFDPGNLEIPLTVEPGLYYIGVRVEAAGDGNSANNTGSDADQIPIHVKAANPDLKVDLVEVVSEDHYATGTAEVEIEVTNQGDLSTGNWTGDFYISPSWYFSEDAVHIATGSASPLSAGDTFHTTVSLPLSAASSGGHYYIHLVVDTPDDEFEYNNSGRSDAFYVIPGVTDDYFFSPPDLKVDYVGIQGGEYGASDHLPVAFSVTNTGGPAGVWHAEIWAVETLDLTGENVKLAEGSAPNLLAGQSFATLEQIALGELSAGSYYLVLVVWSEALETSLFNNIGVAVNTFTIELGLTGGAQVAKPVKPTDPDELPLAGEPTAAQAIDLTRRRDEPVNWTLLAHDPNDRTAADHTEHRLLKLVEGPASVVGRHILYNNSAFDGNDGDANRADDAAIAPDKVALLPGETAAFANYTSYTRGINGVIVDIAGLAAAPSLASVNDYFEFHVGNDNNPAGWRTAPTPINVTVRRGEGIQGSDRATIIWADGAITGQWLELTVLANASTGLMSPDVHYWGNQVGESGNDSPTATNAQVLTTDVLATIANLGTGVAVDNQWDYNKDGNAVTNDVLTAIANTTAAGLRLITVGAATEAAGFGETAGAGNVDLESTEVLLVVGAAAAPSLDLESPVAQGSESVASPRLPTSPPLNDENSRSSWPGSSSSGSSSQESVFEGFSDALQDSLVDESLVSSLADDQRA